MHQNLLRGTSNLLNWLSVRPSVRKKRVLQKRRSHNYHWWKLQFRSNCTPGNPRGSIIIAWILEFVCYTLPEGCTIEFQLVVPSSCLNKEGRVYQLVNSSSISVFKHCLHNKFDTRNIWKGSRSGDFSRNLFPSSSGHKFEGIFQMFLLNFVQIVFKDFLLSKSLLPLTRSCIPVNGFKSNILPPAPQLQ
jgi:hypothetical protein